MRYSFNHMVLPVFLLLTGILVIACPDNMVQKCTSLTVQGDDCYKNGQYRDALSSWEKALTLGLKQDELIEKMIGAHLKLAEFKSAYGLILKLMEIAPGNRNALKLAVRINMIVGNLESAEQYMGQLKALAPDWPRTYEVLGELMVFKNDMNAAEASFAKCLQLSPGDPFTAVKMAQCLLAMGQRDRAETYLQTAVSTTGKGSQLLTLISNYHRLDGNDKLAEDFLIKAIQIDPQNLDVKKELAEFYYEKEDYEKALMHVEDVLSLEKENKTFTLLHVELLLMQKRYAEAKQIIFSFDESLAEDTDVLFLKGKIHLLADEPQAAIQYLKTVVDRQPSNATAGYLLSVAYLNNQNNHTAMATLKKLLMSSRNNSDVDLLLSAIYYKNGEYPVSLKHARRVAVKEPENYQAHMIIGNCLLAQDSVEAAMTFFQEAQRIKPEQIEPIYYLAVCNEKSGRWEAAFESYLQLLEMEPLLLEAGIRSAQLAHQHKRIGDLLDRLKLLEEKHPQNGFYSYLYGIVLQKIDRVDEATAAFSTALKKDPAISAAYIKLSNIYRKRNETEKRLQLLRTAVKIHPNFVEAHIELADALRQQGDLEQSLKALQNAINIDLQDPVLLNNYAAVLMDNGQYNKAFDIARDAHMLMPQSAFSLDTLGWAYYHKKLYSQALWYLNEASKIEKHNALINYHLGMTFYAMQKHSEAYDHLNLAVNNDLPERYRPKAMEILERAK